jgi:hypothetical protein
MYSLLYLVASHTSQFLLPPHLLPFLPIHRCFINFMPELLVIKLDTRSGNVMIKLETRSGNVMIKHFSLLRWIQVMGPTVIMGCLQAAFRILFK